MKNIPAFEKKNKKKKERSQHNKGLIVAIVLLAVLLVGTNVASFFGIWKSILPDTSPVFSLGKKAVLNLSLNSASAHSFEFKGSAVTGAYYNQPIILQMPVASSKYVIRVKAGVNTGLLHYQAKIAQNSNWYEGIDGYYYFLSTAIGGEKINLSNGVIIPQFETKQDKTYQFTIVAETLQTDFDFKTIWQSPQEWTLVELL